MYQLFHQIIAEKLVLVMAVLGVARARAARQRHEDFCDPVNEPVAAVEEPRVAARDLEEVRPTVARLRDVAVFAELATWQT